MNIQAKNEVNAYKLAQLMYDNCYQIDDADWNQTVFYFRLNAENHKACSPRPFGMKITMARPLNTAKPSFKSLVTEILNRY